MNIIELSLYFLLLLAILSIAIYSFIYSKEVGKTEATLGIPLPAFIKSALKINSTLSLITLLVILFVILFLLLSS